MSKVIVKYPDGSKKEVPFGRGLNGKSAYEYAKDGGYTGTEEEFAAKLAAEYLTSESDPTVPSWAKQSTKPTYTASEVGALPATTKIPTKVSELTNDKGYLTDFAESDPTVPDWAKAANKPSYTKNEVGLDHVDNVKQYSASNPPPYPVTSVNGYTGAVSLRMSDLALGHETWTFTLEDGSTVDKLVTLYVSNAAPT